jgi:hypothetical protein
MKKVSIIKIIITAIILVVILMIVSDFVRGFREPVVFIDGDELIIQSAYGVTVTKKEINSVRLINELPTLIRGDGFGVGNVQKGHVKISNLGNGFAYVNLKKGPLYIYLELVSIKGNYVFLHLYDANNTRELYERIQAWLQT